MVSIKVKRNLICAEDLNLGTGNVIQTRAGQVVNLTKINADNLLYNENTTLAQAINNITNITNAITLDGQNLTQVKSNTSAITLGGQNLTQVKSGINATALEGQNLTQVRSNINATALGGQNLTQVLDTAKSIGLKFKLLADTSNSIPESWMVGVTTDNEIIHWGREANYVSGDIQQLSDGYGTNLVPQPAVKKGVEIKKIVPSNWTYMVLYEDGDLYGIGYGGYGALGQGNTANQSKLVFIRDNIKDMTTATQGYDSNHNTWLALDNDGEVWSWGRNSFGQCGSGNSSDQLIAIKRTIIGINPGETIEKIYVLGTSYAQSYLVSSEGRVYSCGHDNYLALGYDVASADRQELFNPITTLSSITDLAPSGNTRSGNSRILRPSVLALDSSGNLHSWGCREYGQLGHGTYSGNHYALPAQISFPTTFRKIVASIGGYTSYFGITVDDDLYGWGRNFRGELGLGDTSARYSPVFIRSNVKDVYTLYGNTYGYEISALIITNDNRMFASGRNNHGQLGICSTTDSYYFTEVNFALTDSIKQVSRGGYGHDTYFNILLNNGAVLGFGYNNYQQVSVYRGINICTVPKMVHF